MGAPQIIVIVLFAIRIAVNAVKDGEPVDDPGKPAKYSKYSFARAVVNVAIFASLLWWGGFFGSAT